ncbi:hypothetical protein FJ365_02295 [Candidatus Dependentiae bacterium]|nr:hypothetical protein [Candidatus Dependentiae bacterium]
MVFAPSRKSLLLLLCILLVVCNIFRALRAEYLIGRKSQGTVVPLPADYFTQRQGALLYETVSKYQWPSVLAFYENGSGLCRSELEKTVLSSRPFAEPEYICKKIKEIDADLFPLWIPNTLYELFVLSYTLTIRGDSSLTNGVEFLKTSLSDHKSKWTYNIVDNELIPAINSSAIVQTKKQLLHEVFIHQRWWKRALALVSKSAWQSNPWTYIFLTVNEFITTELSTMPINVNTTALERLTQSYEYALPAVLYCTIACHLVEAILVGLKKNVQFSFKKEVLSCLDRELTKEGLKPEGVLARTIRLELAAQQKNKAVLFRGTQPIAHPVKQDVMVLDSTLFMPDYQPRSVSYGNGLFAGSLFDPWGTSYWYLVHGEYMGYGLLINKLVTAKNSDQNLFFVPPLSTLHGLFANGQFFHPRTKAVMPLGIVAQVDGIQKFWLRDDLGIIATTQAPLVHEARYLGLLAKNVVMLSDCKQGVSYPSETLKTNMQSLHLRLLEH